MNTLQSHPVHKKLSHLPFKSFQFFRGEKTIPLHSMISHCGHQKADSSDYRWHGLKRGNREFAIWQFSIRGKGAVLYEDKKYEIPEGSAMLVHVPHNHCYFYPENSDEPWEFIFIACNGREFMRIWYTLEKIAGPVINFFPSGTCVQIKSEKNLLADIDNFFNFIYTTLYNSLILGLPETPYTASALSYEFLMKLCNLWSNINIRKEPFNKRQIDNLNKIRQVIDFCIGNISSPVTIDDMASVAGYSRYHFTRIFKKYQAMSPGNFLLDLRMKYALRLLQTEKFTVKEISYKCGFNDPSYFCKIFKKFYNIPPGEFRKTE